MKTKGAYTDTWMGLCKMDTWMLPRMDRTRLSMILARGPQTESFDRRVRLVVSLGRLRNREASKYTGSAWICIDWLQTCMGNM